MRSNIYQLPGTQVSDACTTRWERDSSCRTWRVTSIRRWATVQQVCVLTKSWNTNDTYRYFQIRDPSNLFRWIYSAHCRKRNFFRCRQRDAYSDLNFRSLDCTRQNTRTFLTDQSPQFESKIFESLWRFRAVKHTTTMVYHLQTNTQVDWQSKMNVERLRPYVAEHQNIWGFFVQPLTHAHDTQLHRCIGVPV